MQGIRKDLLTMKMNGDLRMVPVYFWKLNRWKEWTEMVKPGDGMYVVGFDNGGHSKKTPHRKHSEGGICANHV